MFVGHYAAAFAARAARPAVPLWVLFVAVQLVDFAWAGLVLAGIEKVRIIPGFMEASSLDLYHMPYTHSLVAAVIWAGAGGAFYAFMRRCGGRAAAGVIVGAAVLSHWFADLLVHAPDLPLIYGEPKFGFGLWRSLVISQTLEVGLLILGFWLYMTNTRPRGRLGRWGPWGFVAFLLAVQAYSHTLSASENAPVAPFAVSAFASFAILAALAWLADTNRDPKPRAAKARVS